MAIRYNQATTTAPVTGEEPVVSTDFDANTILAADTDNTPAALTVPEQTLVGRITAGNIDALTATESRTLLNVEDGADVTDAANVDAAGAVMEADYNANTILAANADDTPLALTVGEQTLVGRITAGSITALSTTQVRTLINVEDGATADQTNSEIQTAYDAGLTEQTLTDAATISYDVSSGRNANVTLTDNRVLNWTNPVAGQTGIVRIIQDGTGSRTITAYQLAGTASDVLFAGGTAPTLTTTAGAQDVLEWYYDGADIHVRVFSLNSQ